MRGSCLAVLIAALFLMSCCTSTEGDGNDYDQTTVLGTLYLFEDVWNDCDITTYENLLDEESFTFYFDPEDVENWGMSPTWGYDVEIEAYTLLFDALGDENVEVQLDLSEVSEPVEGVVQYLVENIPYSLRAFLEDVWCRGEFHLDLQLQKLGDTWVITDWWDVCSSELLAGDNTITWGLLKALFY